MQIFHLDFPLTKVNQIEGPLVLALGFFDGVHRGHQKVIKKAKEIAELRQLPLAVLTFLSHPRLIFNKKSEIKFDYLTSNKRKEALFQAYGVDLLYYVNFTAEFSQLSPQDFVDQYLVGLQAQVVVAGFDYTYGQKAKANMTTLPKHSQGRFEVVEVAPCNLADGSKIASSSIKQAILTSAVSYANEQLGYIYENSGVVVHGEKRGRQLGYPTANILIDSEELIPAMGVYIVEIKVNQTWYKGMASIGYNITFENDNGMTCEIHILDFNQDIYGQAVSVRWHHYLRSEIKFNQILDLINQLKIDEYTTRQFFNLVDNHEVL